MHSISSVWYLLAASMSIIGNGGVVVTAFYAYRRIKDHPPYARAGLIAMSCVLLITIIAFTALFFQRITTRNIFDFTLIFFFSLSISLINSWTSASQIIRQNLRKFIRIYTYIYVIILLGLIGIDIYLHLTQ